MYVCMYVRKCFLECIVHKPSIVFLLGSKSVLYCYYICMYYSFDSAKEKLHNVVLYFTTRV